MKKILAAILCFCLLLGTCAMGVSAAEKVYSLTMGVHKYSVNSTVSDGADIATVTYTRQKDGSTGSANRLYDIENGEKFTVSTALKDGQEAFYAFLGWMDMDGAIISHETTIELTMDCSKAVFAVYTECANRYVISYSYTGTGSVSASCNKTAYAGTDCLSVMHGSSVTFKMSPSKDFYVSTIKVDGEKVSMLSYSVRTLKAAVSDGNIKGVFNAIINYVKFLMGKEATYTLENVTADHTFAVSFQRPYFS